MGYKKRRTREGAPVSLSKKSIRTFLTSCLQNSKIKNSILFCYFGRCGG